MGIRGTGTCNIPEDEVIPKLANSFFPSEWNSNMAQKTGKINDHNYYIRFMLNILCLGSKPRNLKQKTFLWTRGLRILASYYW